MIFVSKVYDDDTVEIIDTSDCLWVSITIKSRRSTSVLSRE